jgi:hypothetical protein
MMASLEGRISKLEAAQPTAQDAAEGARVAFDFDVLAAEWDQTVLTHGGDVDAALVEWEEHYRRLLGPTDQEAAETLAVLAACDPAGTAAMLAQAQEADAGKSRVVSAVVGATDNPGLVTGADGKVLPLRLVEGRAEAQGVSVLVVIEHTME